MAGQTSRQNGKKGGRPRGSKASHTMEAETIRKYLIKRLVEEHASIIGALISKARRGDMWAIKEVLERTLGKSKEFESLPSVIVPVMIIKGPDRSAMKGA